MAEFDEVLALARQLGAAERERLVRALAPARTTPLSVLSARPAGPQSAGWIKAERGHAVLATDAEPEPGGRADIPAGAEAIAGMWADVKGGEA